MRAVGGSVACSDALDFLVFGGVSMSFGLR